MSNENKEKPKILVKPLKLGGLSESRPASDDIQKLVDSLVEDIKLKCEKKNYPYFKVISYRTQVVAGKNYFIKVDVGIEHLHLRVFESLKVHGNKLELVNVQTGKKLEDKLDYF